mmetsp:Transcript_101933/g.181082  ORF Transcript_101933/g.181082 Transcript_101933/m.181082 type:complete len:202 (+) Transcript_101933:156-761(+)
MVSLLLLLLLGNLSCTSLLLLLAVLGHTFHVVSLHLLTCLHALASQGLEVALALQQRWGDEALNLWSLLFLLVELTADHKLPHVILLLKAKELPDVGSTLGTKAARLVVVSEAWDLLCTFLHQDEVEHCKVWAHNAASHRLALAAARPALSVARHALLEEEPDTVVAEDALLHGEALLVIATSDAEDVALELVSKRITRNF